jgi:raffinose/stachyose/melibiose transport system substrate-binding protein
MVFHSNSEFYYQVNGGGVMYCSKCGCINEENALYCQECGNRLDGISTMQQMTQYDNSFHPNYSEVNVPQKRKRNILPWVISAAGLALAAVLVVLIIIFTKKDAVFDNIIASLKGTLEAKSCEFSIEVEQEYGDYSSEEEISGIFEYDLENEKLNYDINLEDNDESILYDGNVYYVYDETVTSTEDISDELDMIFEYYDEYKDALDDFGKVDWEELIDEAGLSNYFHEDKLQGCMNTLKKKLNDKEFFNKVCNEFQIKKENKETLYTFDFDVTKLTEAVIDIFEPAIDYDIDDFKDEILDQTDLIESFKLEITTQDNRLTSAHFNLEIIDKYSEDEVENNVQFTIEIDHYNKAAIDKDRLDNLIEDIPEDLSKDESVDYTEEASIGTPSKDTSTNTETLPATNETTVLELWYMDAGFQSSLIQDSISRFMTDYPNCTVNLTQVPYEEYSVRLISSIAAGEAPDIFITLGDYNTISYSNDGYIYDMKELMNQDNLKDRIMDAAISQITYKDKILGVPGESTTMVGFFYNKQIFDDYNLSEPATIEELEQICETLKANGIIPFAMGNSSSYTGSMYYSSLAVRKGGIEPFQSAVEGTGSFENECFTYAGEKIQEWVNNGYFNDNFNNMDDIIGEPRQLLYDGSAAMNLMASWYTSIIESESPEFSSHMGFFEFPAYSSGDQNSRIAIGALGGSYYSISSSCETPELAYEAITYLVDDTATNRLITVGYLPPMNTYIPESEIDQEIMEAANNAPTAQLCFDQYLPYQAADVYRTSIHDLFGLLTTPEQVNKAIQDELLMNLP